MHKVVCALDHGVLDPFGRAHQVLHTLVHEDLILSREGALLILQHCFLPARNGFSTALLFLRELRVTASRLLVFGLVPFWGPLPCEELESELLEEVLDDVHHVWADVPNDVEVVEEGQGARTVDSCVVPDVVLFKSLVVVASQALSDALGGIARIGGAPVVGGSECRVCTHPMVGR
jgi:hypothetical protein